MSAPLGDQTTASAARIYNVLLGGGDNHAADREAAALLMTHFPTVRDAARANRGFLLRAVRAMAEAGVDQFLDLGCGLPLTPNTWEIARRRQPEARMVYVDNDETVVAAGQAMMDRPGVITVHGDLREPDKILNDPAVRGLLDFDRPIGVLTVAVLHFVVDDEQARRVVTTLREALVPGSRLAMTHVCSDTMPMGEAAVGTAVYKRTSNPVRPRNRAEITALFAGFDLVDPGLVPLAEWRAEPDDMYPEVAPESLAGVGVIPALEH